MMLLSLANNESDGGQQQVSALSSGANVAAISNNMKNNKYANYCNNNNNHMSNSLSSISCSGSQLELILQRNEARAQELTLNWIDKWNCIEQDQQPIFVTDLDPITPNAANVRLDAVGSRLVLSETLICDCLR